MSVSHSSLGPLATKLRLTRSSSVATLTRFLVPFLGPGRPCSPSWRMIFHTSFLLTMIPCSISRRVVSFSWPRTDIPLKLDSRSGPGSERITSL